MRTRAVKRTLRIAAGAVALGAALAGCGQAGPVKAGAAATLGGKRITTAQVESAAAEWRATAHKAGLTDEDLRQAAPQLAETMADPASPQRSVLYRLIDFAAVEELARSMRINVTAGQVDRTIQQQGGRQRIDVEAFKWGVPPSLARALVARDLRLGQIITRTGVADQQAAIRKIKQLLGATLDRMRLSVNPRFGSFDHRDLLLAPVCTGLSKGTEQAPGQGEREPLPLPARPEPDGQRAGCHPLARPAGGL